MPVNCFGICWCNGVEETLRVYDIAPDEAKGLNGGTEVLDAVWLLKQLVGDLQCRGPEPTLVAVPGVVSMMSMMFATVVS